MADTYTTGLNITKPEPGASQNTWGSKQNDGLDKIDAAFTRVLDGQCRLAANGAQQIVLKPYNGNSLVINGVVCQIPSGGVAFNTSGLNPSSTYFIYAVYTPGAGNAAGTISLEAAVTAYTFDSNGRANKSGDPTRRLVGMARVNAQNSVGYTVLQVLSYFNRRTISDTQTSGQLQTSSTSPVAIGYQSTLCWANETLTVTVTASAGNDTAGNGSTLNLYWDNAGGTTYSDTGVSNRARSSTAGAYTGISMAWSKTVATDGWRNLAIYGSAPGGGTSYFYYNFQVSTQG